MTVISKGSITYIVPEYISDEIVDIVRGNLSEYRVLLFVGCLLELLLDKSRTMLVATEFDHMPEDSLSVQN